MQSKSCALKGNQKTFYIHQNRAASCCRAHSDTLDTTKTLNFYVDKWRQEQAQLDQGIQIPGCDHCWQSEAQGLQSYRLHNNQENNSANVVEIFLSTACNQMCSYCSPKFSSTWQESIQRHGMFRDISASAQLNLSTITEAADRDYWLDQINHYLQTCDENSVMVKLLGGEPLMQQRNLEKLIGFNNSKIRKLGIHTNLNPPNNKFLLWLLDNVQTDKLVFYVSLDACPDYNQWPRGGFDKTQFLANLDLLEQHAVYTKFNSVISVINVFDLENFLTWSRNKSVPINFDNLYNPVCLDAALIPLGFRQQIWQGISKFQPSEILQQVLLQPEKQDTIRLIEQHNYLDQYFQRNALDPNQCPNMLFREYWSWLTENYKR